MFWNIINASRSRESSSEFYTYKSFLFSQVINKYDEIIQAAKPVLKFYKHPVSYYDERFRAFYQFLVEANESNILGDVLARKLLPLLLEVKKHQGFSVKEIETSREP